MTTETILTDEQIDHIIDGVAWPNEEIADFGHDVALAIEQTVLQSPGCAQWADASKGAPHGEGQYVVRINNHGHIRLGQRVLNSDTLRYQWQVDGEICKTVTHYLPIPALTIKDQT